LDVEQFFYPDSSFLYVANSNAQFEGFHFLHFLLFSR